MNRYLRGILLTLTLLITQAFMAQKLYWVGGSGNFNDPAHWSYQSGGVGGAKTPAATDDVYFDENSFLSTSIINFIGATQVHDLIFTKNTSAVTFSGLQNEKITINGNVQLNSHIDNQFAGDIWLTSNQANTSVVFELTRFNGNLYFAGNTNWLIKTDIVNYSSSAIYFKQGTFNFIQGGVFSENFIISPNVVINGQKTTFKIKNDFVLPAGAVFNSNQSNIFAHTNDASKFQVAPSFLINTTSRLHNIDNTMSCSVVNVSNTNPTCAGACNGSMAFSVPVGCTDNPIYAVWSGGCGSPIPTKALTPGSTYTVSNVCGCAFLYSVIFTPDTSTQLPVEASYDISIGDPVYETESFAAGLSKQPLCFGQCNGYVIASLANHGAAPITATWTLPSGGTTVHTGLSHGAQDTLKNACAGTYSVTLKDNNGCTTPQTFTFTLTQPTVVTHTLTQTNILCFGVCNGSIVENMSGGTSPFTFTWTTAGTTTSTATSSTNSAL